MLKGLFYFLFITAFFLLFVYLGAAFIYSQQKEISFIEELRVDSKNILSQIKDVIYYQGQIHNPEGDWVPDWIDDVLKNKIKERI